MKRLLYIFISIGCFVIIPKNENAQTVNSSADKDQSNFLFAYGKTAFSSNVPLNEINTRAFRYFRKRYPNIENEKWAWTDKGMSVAFEDSTSQTRIFFDDKGSFISSAKAYTAFGMGRTLKDELLRLFPDYKVLSVTEDFDGRKILYWITMSKDQSIKSVEVRTDDGEAVDVTPAVNKP
jgi:hypothetical protein